MNIPNRASRHHAMRASRWAGVSFAQGSGLAWAAAFVTAAEVIVKLPETGASTRFAEFMKTVLYHF
jgi:hypothetical protein